MAYKNYIIYLIIGAILVYVTYMAYGMYYHSKVEKHSLNTTLATLQVKIEEKSTQLQEENKYGQRANYLYNTLISQKSITNWVNQENQIAALTSLTSQITFGNATVSVKNIKVENSQTTGGTSSNTLPVSVTLKGSFEGILQYLRMMEDSYFFSNVSYINLTLPAGGTQVIGNITLNLYLQ